MSQLNWFISRGHDVRVLAHRRGQDTDWQRNMDPYGLAERVAYASTLDDSLIKQGLRYAPAWAKLAARNSPMALRSLNPTAGTGPRVFLQRPVWASALDGDDPDIIHCQFGTMQHLGLALLSVCPARTRLAVSIRGRDITAVVQQHGVGVYRELFARGHVFLPCCDALGDRLREAGCPPDRIRVVRSGIDIEQLSYTPRTWTSGMPLQLVTAGRAVEKKGFDVAIKSIALVRDSGIDARLTIFGDGPLIDSLRAIAGECDVDDYVAFTGAYDRSEFDEHMKHAHVFVLPSRTGADGDEEGIPNTGKEAMALGLPVVGTDHSGIGELVRVGETGVLVAQNDVDALAQGIIQLTRENVRWRGLTDRARKTIEEDYAPDVCNSEMEKAFEFALASLR